MSDLISRQAAIREYQKVCNGIKCGECPFLIKVNTEKGSHLITDCKLEAFLHNLPSEERRGRWIRTGEDGYCSICNCDMPMYKEDWEWRYLETPYCPNCGARMEAVTDD